MYYYAIRHKPTGHFLPRFPGQWGGTWVEPTDKEPPRLFRTGGYASLSLNHWLERKVATRNRDEMEIVRLKIEVDHD